MGNTRVSVLLFSSLRERTGSKRLEIEVAAEDPTAMHVFDGVTSAYPEVAGYRDYVRVAVNGVYSDWSSAVRDGDEIALITPVSGG